MIQLTQSTLVDLDTAYRQTLYEVFLKEGVIQLRVDIINSDLDQLLQQYHQSSWALITAYNPHSQSLEASENHHRNRALLTDLKMLNLPLLDAVGRDESGQWSPEESFFIVGIRQADAISIGQKFAQNAILYGEIGSPPELLWLL